MRGGIKSSSWWTLTFWYSNSANSFGGVCIEIEDDVVGGLELSPLTLEVDNWELSVDALGDDSWIDRGFELTDVSWDTVISVSAGDEAKAVTLSWSWSCLFLFFLPSNCLKRRPDANFGIDTDMVGGASSRRKGECRLDALFLGLCQVCSRSKTLRLLPFFGSGGCRLSSIFVLKALKFKA